VEWIGLTAIASILRAWDVQINHDWLLAASHDHCFHRFIPPGVEFLVRNKGRNLNEVARAGFLNKLQIISPPKPGAATNDVNHRF
jgi:hypothetical protein